MKLFVAVCLIFVGVFGAYRFINYVDNQKSKCKEEQGFYFKARCVKEGKILW
jgi:hypothetical protein